VEDLVKTGLLYDFYGGLLTEKQQKIMDLYYNEDWSMAEIAEKEAVSRQAVHDLLHRSQRILEDYEEKLGLLQRFLTQQALLKSINADLLSLAESISQGHPGHVYVTRIQSKIEQLIATE